MQQRLFSFEPATRGQEALHAETIRQFNVYIEHRRLRLNSVSTGLPAILWYVVGGGAILNLALIWLFSIDKLTVHLILAGVLALFIGLLIFLIAAMDNPYRGEFSVSAEPFELIRRSLMDPDVRKTL